MLCLSKLRADLRRENAAKPIPDPVCKRCRMPHAKEDRDWLFSFRCQSCGAEILEKLVRQIAGRHGRKRTVRLLRRLAK